MRLPLRAALSASTSLEELERVGGSRDDDQSSDRVYIQASVRDKQLGKPQRGDPFKAQGEGTL